jgi:hypothetical protein
MSDFVGDLLIFLAGTFGLWFCAVGVGVVVAAVIIRVVEGRWPRLQ